MSRDRTTEFEPHEAAFLQDIGSIFRQFRLAEGWTHKQAAAAIGMTTGKISSLENAKSDLCLLSLQKWANAYGYHIEISFIPMEVEDGTNEAGEHLSSLSA